MFLVIFILGIFVYEKYSDMLTHKQVLEISASQYNSSDKTNHTKVRILCLITTEWEYHRSKASVVYSTWGSRCDKVVFVSDKREDEIELPVMQVNITGRNNLWGKTREAVLRAWREYATDVDWILKADHDTYVIMENLKNLLSHFNASKPLLAGSIFICRKNIHECHDFDGDNGLDEVYMTGGSGYAMSREAARIFVAGHSASGKCRPGNVGPEDVEMSRCLQRLGVNFIDTRDKYGRNRFSHFSGEDSLSMFENRARPDISWVENYKIFPLKDSPDCCSNKAISFHHLSPEQIKQMEYLVYNLRPHVLGEEDLTLESILPNRMLNHSHILEVVLNIRNTSLRKEVLAKDYINLILVDNIIATSEILAGNTFNVGDIVVLKLDLLLRIERTFEIIQIVTDRQSSLLTLQTTGNSDMALCKIETIAVAHKLNITQQQQVTRDLIQSSVKKNSTLAVTTLDPMPFCT